MKPIISFDKSNANSFKKRNPTRKAMDSTEQATSSSDSGSDSESDIASLQSAVTATKTLSAHLSLIAALRKNADLSSLRVAFHAASEAHLLPPSVWHAHLTEEETLATTPPQQKSLLNLHTRALQDSQASLLHASRLVFAAGLLREGVIERGFYDSFLSEAELYGAGYDDAFRERCATLPGAGSVMKQPPTEHEIFEKRLRDAKIEDSSATQTSIYLSYARFAETIPEFAIAIYERALFHPGADVDLWQAYDAFLARVKHPARFDVLQRACRSKPTELELWRRAAAIADPTGLVKVVEKVTPFALRSEDLPGAGRLTKEIWTRYFSLGCPAIATELLKKSLEFNIPESDEWASATTHAAAVLLKAGEREAGVALMASVVDARPEGRWWLVYAGMMEGEERRRVYERSLRSVGSIAEVHTLRDAWEVYEIGCGCEGLGERMNIIAKGVALRDGERMKTVERIERRANPPKRRRAERNAGDGKKNKSKGKRKGKSRNEDAASGVDRDSKVENGDVDKMEEDGNDGEGQPTESDAVGAERKTSESPLPGKEKKAKADGVEPKTVFLNNLPFSVSESDLQEAFAFAGEVEHIRLPRRSDGASKGIAYIQFAEEDAIEKALTRHNKPIKGRAVWVRRSKPPPRGKKPARGGGGGGARGGRAGSRGGRRRVLIHPPRQRRLADTDGEEGRKDGQGEDVVMRDGEKSGGLGQDDFRRMFLK